MSTPLFTEGRHNHDNEYHQNITMESDFLRHMKDGNNYDDIEMPVGMRGSG